MERSTLVWDNLKATQTLLKLPATHLPSTDTGTSKEHDMSLPLPPSELPVDAQPYKKTGKFVGSYLVWLAVFAWICLNVVVVFSASKSPYALSRTLWYADFRFWSPWVSGCCWLVFLWACVSTAISLLVPQKTERFPLLRRSLFQKVLAIVFVFLIWVVWYNYAVLSMTTVFDPILSPISTYIDTHYTLPLADHYTTKEGRSPAFFPTLFVVLVAVAFISWRLWHYFKRWRKPKDTVAMLFLIGSLPILLGADVHAPPPKVETSVGIYDVQSKDDLLKFTAEEIRKLVEMEDDRTRGNSARPHPILVYCFEERSFQYTGGKYDEAEIKYRLRVPNKIDTGRKYPLVVHLHGIGEAGRDNMLSLAHLHSILPLMVGPEQQDFYLLVLQCPPNDRRWTFTSEKDGNLDVIIAATDHVIENNPIDVTRLSIFGLSSGGTGVWEWLKKEPARFAAAVPASCGAPRDLQTLVSLTKTSIWTFLNKNDRGGAYAESVLKAMRVIDDSGGFIKLTQFDQGGHAAWRPAMDEYNCFAWMIAQKRGGWFNPPPERKVYQGRSLTNSFFAFFLPLGLAAWLFVFQRSRHCELLYERMHRHVVKILTPHRSLDTEERDNVENIVAVDLDGFRTWSGITGEKQFKAKMVGFYGDNQVRMQSPEGKVATVPIK